jgi:hypothetical protein
VLEGWIGVLECWRRWSGGASPEALQANQPVSIEGTGGRVFDFLPLGEDVCGDGYDKNQADKSVTLKERLINARNVQLRRGTMLVN